MSLLEFVNKFIFQWFFIRMFKGGEKLDNGTFKITVIGFLYFIIPLTGWSNSYRYPFSQKKPKSFRVKSFN